MSQDSEVCIKCGVRCGYDDDKAYSEEHNKAYCSRCRKNIERRFETFFGIEGCASTHEALEIDWDDVDQILSKIKRDEVYRVSYLVTDKEWYERELDFPTPIENDVTTPAQT